MKKIIFAFIIVLSFLLFNSYSANRPFRRCLSTVDFDISDPEQLEKYLTDNLWIVTQNYNTPREYTRGKQLIIKISDTLHLSTWAAVYEDEIKTKSLDNIGVYGAMSTPGKIDINYYDQEKRYPYLGNEMSIIEIAEDYYITEYCDSSGCTLWKHTKSQIENINFNGVYKYKDKTLIIEGEDLYHAEADKHYIIHQTDTDRLSINGQIISEMPGYRFWIDEEENIILLSDGLDLFGIDEETIKAEYPFYVLVKQK